jgi:hypothetical protein
MTLRELLERWRRAQESQSLFRQGIEARLAKMRPANVEKSA